MSFADDIPADLARSAHTGTSFDPDRRAQQERDEYAGTLAADWENLSRLADTDEKRATLAEEFARYRQGYRRRALVQLAAKSRCVSTMIAGPSNFPTGRASKASASADKRLQDLIEFRERALAAIRKVLCPELRPIMAGDDDATERLRDKIAKLENLHAAMKAANAAIRKHAKAGPDAQVAALVALGHPEGRARQLLEPDFAGRVGFADYEITTTGANLRRLKGRLVAVERNQATPDTTAEGERARIEDCPAENRVRLVFPGKPAAEVRDRLKASGFRWTPSLGCWQAYRNPSSLDVASAVAGLSEKEEHDGPR